MYTVVIYKKSYFGHMKRHEGHEMGILLFKSVKRQRNRIRGWPGRWSQNIIEVNIPEAGRIAKDRNTVEEGSCQRCYVLQATSNLMMMMDVSRLQMVFRFLRHQQTHPPILSESQYKYHNGILALGG